MNEQAKKASLESVAGILRRRRRLAGLVAGLGCTACVSVVAFLPDAYESSATVLIERQQIPDEFVKPTVTGALDTRLQTMTQEILSRTRLEALIERFGLYPDLRQDGSVDSAVELMRESVRVEMQSTQKKGDKTTVAFTISYRGREPEKVAQVANTLASFYIEENLKARERQAIGTAEFLRVQLEEVNAKLADLEGQVSAFKELHLGELPQQTEANLARLEQLSAELRANTEAQARVGEQRAALQKQLAEAEGLGTPGGPYATAARLAELNKQLAELRAKYSEKYPDVVRIQAEVAVLTEELGSGREPRPRAEHVPVTPQIAQLRRSLADVGVEQAGLKREEEDLRRTVAVYRRRVENAPRREQEFQALAREYEATKDLHRSLTVRYREAELGESMEQRQKGEQFRILDPATASAKPAAPNRPQWMALGILLSLGLAAAAVMAKEQFDTSYHSTDEVKAALRVPVLASIPSLLTAADRRAARRGRVVALVGGVLAAALIVGGSYFLASEYGPLARFTLR